MERIGFGARHRNLSPPPVSSPFSNEKGEEECRGGVSPRPLFSSSADFADFADGKIFREGKR